MSSGKREYYPYHWDKLLGDYPNMKSPKDISFKQKENPKSKYLIFAFLFFLACVIITVVALHTVLSVSGVEASESGNNRSTTRGKDGNCSSLKPCADACTIGIVESIPENLTYPSSEVVHPTIYSGLLRLIQSAEDSVDIASSYWTLRGKDTNTSDPSTSWGETLFEELVLAGKRGVQIRIVQSYDKDPHKNQDTRDLEKMGVAQVRSLNLERLIDSGILHSKMWLVDGKHYYLGSANLDWRSLTQVKELGFMTYNCSCLAKDMSKIFEAYWMLATPESYIPKPWPSSYNTGINVDTPANITINGSQSTGIFLSSSPPELCPSGRTVDIDAILNIIAKAEKFVYVEVMDYFPTTLYERHNTYWPVIDDALRKAAFDRKVAVRLLAGLWKHTRPDLKNFLMSLSAINGSKDGVSVETRFFKVPIYTKAQAEIPFARVNHDKFMVTDKTAYVGTSNWAADYFISTGGIGYIINDQSNDFIRRQLQSVFERDWNSKHTVPVQ